MMRRNVLTRYYGVLISFENYMRRKEIKDMFLLINTFLLNYNNNSPCNGNNFK